MTLTISRPKPSKAQQAERAYIATLAANALTIALEGVEDRLRPDLARASIRRWAAFLVAYESPLSAGVHLSALIGKIAPSIKPQARCQLARDTFGGRG